MEGGHVPHRQRPNQPVEPRRAKQHLAPNEQEAHQGARHHNEAHHLRRRRFLRGANDGKVPQVLRVTGQRVRPRHPPDAVEGTPYGRRQPQGFPMFRVEVLQCAEPLQHGINRGQAAQGPVAAQRAPLVLQIEGHHAHPEQQRDDTQTEIRATRQPPPPISPPATPAQRLPQQAEGRERQQQREDVPAQQKRHAGLHHQLPEAAFQREDRHAVEHEGHAEERQRLRGDQVVVVEAIGRGEREQRGRKPDPRIPREPAHRVEHQQRRGRAEQQHQHPRGVDLRREAIEGQRGELDEEVTAHREAVVGDVAHVPLAHRQAPLEQQEIVRGREVHRDGEVVGGKVVVMAGSIELAALMAEQERRR